MAETKNFELKNAINVSKTLIQQILDLQFRRFESEITFRKKNLTDSENKTYSVDLENDKQSAQYFETSA